MVKHASHTPSYTLVRDPPTATRAPQEHQTQFIWRMSLLMLVSRLPKSPPWTKCLNFRVLQPPVGLESLNGQRKFEA